MNTIELLWQQYLRTEYGGVLPPLDQVAAQRRAFFTGGWCQSVLEKKLRSLDPVSAGRTAQAIELELAREVCLASAPPERSAPHPMAA